MECGYIYMQLFHPAILVLLKMGILSSVEESGVKNTSKLSQYLHLNFFSWRI